MSAAPQQIEALAAAGHLGAAWGECQKALKARPGDAALLFLKGRLAASLDKPVDAIKALELALKKQPEVLGAWGMLAGLSEQTGAWSKAAAAWEHLAAQTGDAKIWFNAGNAHRRAEQAPQSLVCYDKAHTLDPQNMVILSALVARQQAFCDWRALEKRVNLLEQALLNGQAQVQPFRLLALNLGSQALFANAQRAVAGFEPRAARKIETYPKQLTVGYLSADFHRHATAYLTADLFECHDRNLFKILAFSCGPDDKSDIRQRLKAAFDGFIECEGRSDSEIAAAIEAEGVDILIDLKGHTRDGRLGVLAQRPAPIQLAWLGYPGTTGAAFIDGIIADPIVLPKSDQPFYSETIYHLPHCYQSNDRKRPIPAPPSRKVHGLPDNKLVLGCFNAPYKITPDIFAVWMDLLRTHDDAILWLMEGEKGAADNLRGHAKAAGVDPKRLYFAPHAPLVGHLGRYALMDLMLDTAPYNAHTTGSDALWMGCPVLTCRGDKFAGRVGASLLSAVGLPELIAEDLDQYKAKALELLANRARLQELRDHLQQGRATFPLFDTPRFTRDLEALYLTIAGRA